MSFVQGNNKKIICRRLEGKIAIVTGSTRGIGYQIARRLAQEGASVMISSRKKENVKKAIENLLHEELQVSGLVCHVGNQEDRNRLLQETISKFGGLDILVLCAGINPVPEQSILDCSEKVWDKIFDINVKSTFFFIKESLSFLKLRKSSSIILMSTAAAYESSLGVYSVSKATLISLCRAVAFHYTKYGIRINCIAPGLIETDFSKVIYNDEKRKQDILSKTFMKRIGLASEISGVAAFLSSEDASYMSGETIIVSGGTCSSRL